MIYETCFILLTPEARNRGLVGEILARFERMGFMIQGLQARDKTPEWVRAMWGAVTPVLVESWTNGPVIGFGIHGPSACLRAGDAMTRIDDEFSFADNLVHVAITELDAVREGELFYDNSTTKVLKAA